MRANPKSLRICYIASPEFFSKGAYAVHAVEMCKAMDKLGIEFEAVVPGRFACEDIFEYYAVKKPFRLTSLPFTKYKGRQLTHGVSSALYALLNKRKFDLVLTRNIICASILTRAGGFPTVYDAHHPPVNPATRKFFQSFQNSRSLAAVSFNTEGLRGIYLRNGLDRAKTVVAHNGVETEDFNNRPSPREIRKQLGLPSDRPIICYCGNTYAGRGIESLVETAEEIKDAVFLVVGGLEADNAPYIEAAKKKGLENFVVKGFVPHAQVPLYLLAADILTLPYTERITIKGGTKAAEFTSPMKLFEYMAAGKPIVSTGISTVLEVLKDGENSVIAAPGDREGLAKAMRRCLGDAEFSGRIARRAREEVRKYTWEERVLQILSFVSDKV